MSVYTDPDWLRSQIRDFLAFCYPTCLDERHGGFVAQLGAETGAVYDRESKHLVATARFTRNFALAYDRFGEERYLDWYDRLWAYATDTLTAPAGNWCERVDAANEPYPTAEGPAVESGYHPIGAFDEAIRRLGE